MKKLSAECKSFSRKTDTRNEVILIKDILSPYQVFSIARPAESAFQESLVTAGGEKFLTTNIPW